MIGRAGIGVDNVDIPAATAKGIIVMNTPFGNSITTAEHAIAMMFAIAREIPAADASTQAGKWEKNRFMGVEITGQDARHHRLRQHRLDRRRRARNGLQMRVIAFDPFLTPERARELGVEKVELDDLLARADFITLHTPLTPQDQASSSAEKPRQDQEGRAHHQLRRVANSSTRTPCARRSRSGQDRGRRLRRVRGKSRRRKNVLFGLA